ncbi:MAG: PKD domain-containing protein [Methanomicrobiales archaeon]|nr:PKD domain-containing protein [Methanomicrobiales archaeon]
MLCDVASGTVTLLTPDTEYTDQVKPSVCGNRVVWEDWSSGWGDIMMLTLGSNGPCAAAAFAADPQIGPCPLQVAFSDLSTGAPTWRRWDFGDENGTDEQNPVHVYTASGRYTVMFEVGTPVCRDLAVSEDYITVGAAPRANFSANRTEGYAPLAIAFTDTSTGSPGGWQWDFGDGSSADSHDPVHVFTAGGSYPVQLTVANEFGSDTVLRPEYITIIDAVPGILRFATPGVAVLADGRVAIDSMSLTDLVFNLAENRSLVSWKPDAGSGLARIRLIADSAGFVEENGTLSGFVVQTVAESRVLMTGASLPTELNFVCPGWYPEGAVRVASWDNATPNDIFDLYEVLYGCDYTGFSSIAATMEVDPGGTPVAGMTVRMGADAGWAAREEETARIAFVRLTGYGGEVLPARRIAANGTVWFEADAPGEASRFVLASLTGSGNPFQFVYRVIEQYVTDNPEKAGASLAGATGRDVPIEEIASEYAESMAIGSGLLSLDESGCTACPLSVWAEGGTCTLFVPAGTRATGCDCEPLQEITVMSIDTGDLPAVQEDAALPLGGVDLQPDGATFEPAVRLTFALPSCYATDFGMPAIRRWNATAMDWEPVATVVDAANGTATGTVDHFCIVGLFAEPYPTATPSPVPPAPTAAPAAPAVIVPTMRPTHLTITAGLVAWATDMAVRHPHVIAAAVVLAALLGARRIRR